MDGRMEHEAREVAGTLHETTEQMKSKAGELSEKAKQASERIGAAWESARTNIQEKTLASARATDRAVRDNPYTSLGIAFGLGLLIGVLVNRGR